MTNRRRENLIPIIEQNVYTNEFAIDDIDFRTGVYSDCYAVYRESDFAARGFLLHRVNHSVQFGFGSFHTNKVEGLWSCLKCLSNHFSGITFDTLDKLEKEGKNPSDYIDDWICYFLFLRDINRFNLDDCKAREFLSKILEIN